MKPPRTWLKAAVVGCSVLLAAGFVSYRAGAFDSFLRPPPAPVDPDPASAVEPASTAESGKDATYFSTSKSIIIAPVAPPASTTTTPKSPATLGGSKSAPIFPPAAPSK
jgi:hypothetical protein